jgi:hypothetical protein
VSRVVLDDHLLRDVLADEIGPSLAGQLRRREPATTNLYLLRLAKSVVAARGGALTGSWPADQRRALGRALIELPSDVEVVPMRELAFRMAELAATVGPPRLSNLGAEAVAASEWLDAPLCVWEGDDGPAIRAGIAEVGGSYLTLSR